MALVSRRRCGAVLVVWCLFAWSMTYFAYRLQTDKKNDRLVVGNMRTLSTIKVRRSVVPKKTESIRSMQGNYMNMSIIQVEMASRRALLLQQCKRLKIREQFDKSPFSKDYMHRIMVDKDKTILFCFIPKIANTNFRRTFLYVQGRVKRDRAPKISGYDVYTKHAGHFKFLHQYREKERAQLLNSFKQILFVREPLERLLSAYRNKFFHPNEGIRDEYIKFYTDFYANHQALLRGRNPLRKNLKEKPVTFEEFLVYWNDAFEHKIYINEHFIPTFLLSCPCEIQYDLIGKYETLGKDVRAIFLNLGMDVEFPPRNDNYSVTNTVDLVEQFYTRIPNTLFKKTWKYLQFDSTLFGYKLPDWAKQKLV